jgi:hypothetical protein
MAATLLFALRRVTEHDLAPLIAHHLSIIAARDPGRRRRA